MNNHFADFAKPLSSHLARSVFEIAGGRTLRSKDIELFLSNGSDLAAPMWINGVPVYALKARETGKWTIGACSGYEQPSFEIWFDTSEQLELWLSMVGERPEES